jgi:hypothetical protein
MKQIFNILIFVFLTETTVGQTDSLIIGNYEFLEQKGVHVFDQFGTQQVYCDTLVVITLYLDTNHRAYFRNDTILNPYSSSPPEFLKTLYGVWSVENDTLQIHLSEFSISKLMFEEGQIIKKERLSIPIVQKYSFLIIDEMPNKELLLINEEHYWTLCRNEENE